MSELGCIESVLYTEEVIDQKVRELAEIVSEQYKEKAKEGLVLVGILKGSIFFISDLARRLTIPHQLDFMALSSYGSKTVTTGAVRIIMDMRADIYNKHVLIVEDIVDSGYTLQFLQNLLATRKPRSIATCVFLRKPERMKVQVFDETRDFMGFDIPNEWIVGYGLDYDERFRSLPFVGILKREVYEK